MALLTVGTGWSAWSLTTILTAAAAFVAKPPQLPPGGLPAPRPVVKPVKLTPIGLTNPSFEQGLTGWTKTGTAFDHQPTLEENVTASRVGPVSVGGSYWKDVIYPIGIRGEGWIGTYEKRPKKYFQRGRIAGDSARGTLTSATFKLPVNAKYLTFLIGGGKNTQALKVELLEVQTKEFSGGKKPGPGQKLTVLAPISGIPAKTGLNSEVMRRDWWDIHRLDHQKQYAIRITDNSSGGWGHINVDDFRFETQRPNQINVNGHPALLRTKIKNTAVYVDYYAPLWGAADLHTHPMSHLSMGGKLMHGAPDIGSLVPAGTQKRGNGCNNKSFRAKNVNDALGDCSASHGGWGTDNTCGDHIRAFAINVGFDSDFEHTYPPAPHEGKCPAGQVMDAGLCYEKCQPGFHGTGLLCQKDCPAGFRDDGEYCAKPATYGRGVGYTFNNAKARCEQDNPQGCEQYTTPSDTWYPKCRDNFHNEGCCLCSPDCPAGMRDIGVSCEKGGTYARKGGHTPTHNFHGDHPHPGYPAFVHWPHFSSKSHQQMYVDWIRRAHDGGLNMLVALAVNNELLGAVVNGNQPMDDKHAGDLQIDEIRKFIARHTDFMREVKTPEEFRKAVLDGKLAVVVGVELDNIGNFQVGNPNLAASASAVKKEIRRLYNKGVRYIFPLHFADNVFGGVAVKGGLFNLSNRFARTRPLPIGTPFPPGFLYKIERAKDPDITYRLELLGPDGEWAHGLTFTTAKILIDLLGTLPFPPAFDAIKCPVPTLSCVPQFKLLSSLLSPDSQWDMYTFVKGGHVNQRGLTPIGEVAIREMMKLGMIIDVDHMSDKAVNRTLQIAEQYNYPLVSGHTGFRDKSKKANENLRSASQLSRLGKLGGMMGVGWAGADARAFLHNYRYGLAHSTRNPNTKPPSFSLGSDINGFEEMPKRRPGSRVSYDMTKPDGLKKYKFGNKTWDYNQDGVAHIGLYPDIWQDLRNLGMRLNERTEFFTAVDSFATMWDTIERQKSTLP